MSWLLRFTLRLVVLFLFSICDIYGTANQALFWELKPYIWIEEGHMKGILPSIFHNAKVHCLPHTEGETLDFKVQFKGYEEFNNAFASNVSYGEGILKNVSNIGEPFWMPFLVQHDKIKPSELQARNVTLHVIASATTVSVVVSRREISLPVKLIRGIESCGSIVSIAFMLSTLFGALIWIIERNNGSEFNDCIYNGLWWSQVTMTTTGYGDFVPITGLGKLAASIWMFCGIIVVAVTTATVSDSVNGLSGLGIRQKKVAVLKNSFEELIASRDFESTTVSCSSYEDVYEAVKNGEAFAALVNTDVLAWGLEKLTDNTARKNPLSIIQHIPAEFPITFAGKIVNKTTDPFFECVFKMYEREILIWTQKFFKKYVEIETIYIGQIYETLFDEPIFLTLTCAAGLLLVLCVLHEIMKCFKGRKKSNEMMTYQK